MTSNQLPSRIVRVLLTIALLSAAIYGYASDQKAKRYSNAPNHFSLEIPSGWTRSPDRPNELAAFSGSKKHDFTANVNITSSKVGAIDLAVYTEITKTRFARFKAGKTIKLKGKGKVAVTHIEVYRQKATTLGGIPAVDWRLEITASKRPDLETRQVFCIKDQRVFVVSFTNLKRDMKTSDPMFDKLLASFRWEK